MNYDKFNRLCKGLPKTTHVVQWGGSHVWKVGGKVFAVGGWAQEKPAFTFKTSREDFEVLVQLPGLRPAPYLASRGLSWVQNYKTPGLSDPVLAEQIRQSHRLVASGLTKKAQRELGLLP
jgi:predicted DNA-binding protein (MmcQ/YjbR family)